MHSMNKILTNFRARLEPAHRRGAQSVNTQLLSRALSIWGSQHLCCKLLSALFLVSTDQETYKYISTFIIQRL